MIHYENVAQRHLVRRRQENRCSLVGVHNHGHNVRLLTDGSLQCRQIPDAGYMYQCTVEGETAQLNGTECVGRPK